MKKYSAHFMRLATLVLYISTILFLFVTLLNSKNGISMLDDMTPIHITGTASIDGGSLRPIGNQLWDEQIYKTLTLNGTFDTPIEYGQSIIIWPRNLRIKLYVNGELKISAGQRDSFPDFIEYAGNSYQIYQIGEVTTDDVIKIEIEKAYVTCRINVISTFLDNMFVGNESSVYQSIVTNDLLHPFIGLVLILIGFLILLSSVIEWNTYQTSIRRVFYLGCFCIVGGVCYVCDSSYEFIDLLFPYPVFNTIIDLLGIPTLIFFFLMYTLSVLKVQSVKKVVTAITVFYVLINLIPLSRQFLGISDLHTIQDEQVILSGIAMLAGLLSIAFELIHWKNKELKRTLYAILPLTISLILKIINVLMERGVERIYLRMGILVSCLLLLHSTLRYIQTHMNLLEQQKRLEQEVQNSQISIMLSQIQPHFLYNSLNIVEHLCVKDGVLAAEAIEHFSRYLRGNMESLTNNRPIPFEKELDHVNHYLYMEQLRFGERVRVQYDLEVTNFYLPTLTLQPIVENAVRHGITKQAKGGTIQIKTEKNLTDIILTIQDDGIGFDPSNPMGTSRQHVGLKNVKKRLELQCHATMDVQSMKGVGTTVTIRFKTKE